MVDDDVGVSMLTTRFYLLIDFGRVINVGQALADCIGLSAGAVLAGGVFLGHCVVHVLGLSVLYRVCGLPAAVVYRPKLSRVCGPDHLLRCVDELCWEMSVRDLGVLTRL